VKDLQLFPPPKMDFALSNTCGSQTLTQIVTMASKMSSVQAQGLGWTQSGMDWFAVGGKLRQFWSAAVSWTVLGLACLERWTSKS